MVESREKLGPRQLRKLRCNACRAYLRKAAGAFRCTCGRAIAEIQGERVVLTTRVAW